ncbi:MAG: hypothetical protein A2934_00215 [Candidatus Sungbacteria bacterium RIFCSPLOWO2_01_FULL_47_10]|uniref:MobA-like NTP transferase domain-containing protein n=1 Tax=Candidatus Sungbacteria bacterium RIFCSPLOWO2_01_FULL_47_10 TaxID=1802276 RepID=A0A1G2L8A0_9BACT|nr:MAG: hypothetical protein A2934_00215 [Candidatus Sungbacteria bacterium RIFCSPLOWO2_01_FULL_47_10]
MTKSVQDQKDSTAVILAAGRGTRLLPHTKDTPKCLLEVAGSPILFHQLSSLEKSGIMRIIVVVGFFAEKVKALTSAAFPHLPVTFVHNPVFETTNTLYSLALAAEKITSTGSVFLLNGDVVFMPEIIQNLSRRDPEKSFLVISKKKCGNEEVKIQIAEDGLIVSVNKAIDPAIARGEAVGINKFSPGFWGVFSEKLKILKDGFANEYFEYALERSISAKNSILPYYIHQNIAMEIDFPDDLKNAKKFLV